MTSFYGARQLFDGHLAHHEASSAKQKASEAQFKAETTQQRLDRLMMVSEAMWTLMRDKLGVTDDELVARVNEIDLSDGKLDGKVRRPAVSCPKCNRTIARRFTRCTYCGQPLQHDPFN